MSHFECVSLARLSAVHHESGMRALQEDRLPDGETELPG